MITLIALTGLGWAGCPATTTPDEVTAAALDAEASFALMDEREFDRAATASLDRLECLDTAVLVTTAAALHRVEALRGFVGLDSPRTLRAYSAVHTLTPDYLLPEGLAPLGHPLRESFALALAYEPAPPLRFPRQRDARLFVDGSVARAHPTDRPFVLQREHDGAWTSAYVADPTTLPPWVEPSPGSGGTPRVALLIGAGGVGAVGAGVYAYAWTQRSRYNDLDTPLSDFDGLRKRTNGATVAAAVLGGVAVATATTALVVQW